MSFQSFYVFSFLQGYLASLTSKPHWLCHVNKPQELSAKVLSLNWGKFSGSQSIVFSPDGRQLCCGTNSETGHVFYLTIWDVETGKLDQCKQMLHSQKNSTVSKAVMLKRTLKKCLREWTYRMTEGI